MKQHRADEIKVRTMNLQQAKSFSDLRRPMPAPKTKSAVQVARRVCELAASIGEHMVYKRLKNGNSKKHTPETWADRWLSSNDFVLMEVSINAAASPNPPKNPKRVKHYIKAASSKEANEPIVIDLNKRKVGQTTHGFVPEVVVLDGKHRRQAKLSLGEKRIMAWVGRKALKKIKPSLLYPQDVVVSKHVTRLEAAADLYAAVAPSTGLAKSVARQDSGEGGSRPVDNIHSKKKEDCNACGARSSGSLNAPSASDADGQDTSDAAGDDASDRRTWNPDKPNVYSPGTGPGYTKRFSVDPAQASPGSGSGPRVINKGGSKSDFARTVTSGKEVKKIWNKKKKVQAVAPPGREDQVLELKKKFGEDSAAPFKIAWSQHNRSKKGKK